MARHASAVVHNGRDVAGREDGDGTRLCPCAQAQYASCSPRNHKQAAPFTQRGCRGTSCPQTLRTPPPPPGQLIPRKKESSGVPLGACTWQGRAQDLLAIGLQLADLEEDHQVVLALAGPGAGTSHGAQFGGRHCSGGEGRLNVEVGWSLKPHTQQQAGEGRAGTGLGRSWGQTGRATKQGVSKAGGSVGGGHQSRGTQPHPGDLAGRRVLPPTPKAEQREFRMGLPPETPSPALQPQEVQGQDPNHTAPLQHQGSSLWTAGEGRLARIPRCWSRMRAGITANHRTRPNQSDSGLSSQRQWRLARPLQGQLRELRALRAPGDGCGRRPEEPLALPQPRAGTNPASAPSRLHGPWQAGAAGRRAPPRRAAGGRWRRWRLPARARRACPGASPPEQLAPSSR